MKLTAFYGKIQFRHFQVICQSKEDLLVKIGDKTSINNDKLSLKFSIFINTKQAATENL